MLEAYFDESERPSGVFCIAGYTFAPEQAKKFKKEWTRLFEKTGGFHMVDMAHRREAFKDISRDECNRMLKEAVSIVNDRVTAGVAVSCNVNEVNLLTPKWIRGFAHAYPICAYLCMMVIGRLIDKQGVHGNITYVFEAGHKFEAEALEFIKTISQVPDWRDASRYGGHAALPKKDAIPLQAADLFAYEWAKFRDETLEQKKRPIRKSLLNLFKRVPSRYGCFHLTGKPLERYFYKIRDLGLLQLQEEQQGESRPK